MTTPRWREPARPPVVLDEKPYRYFRNPIDFCTRCGEYSRPGAESSLDNAPWCWSEFLAKFS